jgi:hypothetical protein
MPTVFGVILPESSTYTGDPANDLSALKPEAATRAATAAASVRGRNERDFIIFPPQREDARKLQPDGEHKNRTQLELNLPTEELWGVGL